MNYKLGIVLLFAILLSSCATPKQPPGFTVTKSRASMAEASYAVSRSIADLAETAQASHPIPELQEPPAPASYGMGGATTIDWSGPVEPLLQQIARASDYRVRVLGTEPAIPVIVTVYAKNTLLGDILRDVGYQCGRRASVLVFPDTRVIELRYAKN